MSVPDPPPAATLLTNINGPTDNGYFGTSVSMNADGSIVAIRNMNGTKYVRVWKNENGTWTQLGDNIPLSGDGRVSLNSTGYVLIGEGQNNGSVKVYQYSSDQWQQMGSTIDGSGGYFGGQGVLSPDGNIIAIGAPNLTSYAGQVQVWRFDNTAWTQLGTSIDGSSNSQQFGYSVDLSSDGNIVARGSPPEVLEL